VATDKHKQEIVISTKGSKKAKRDIGGVDNSIKSMAKSVLGFDLLLSD